MRNKSKKVFLYVSFCLLVVLAFSHQTLAADVSKTFIANLIDKTNQLSLLEWILRSIVIPIIVAAIASYGFLRFVYRKEVYLYRNLKRPIMVIEPTDANGKSFDETDLKIERQMLKDNGFLNLSDEVCNFQTFNPNNNHCLVVLGYHAKMAGLDEILTKVKQKYIPIIIYTYGKNTNAISKDDQKKLNSYPWILYANFKPTLLNSIFTTLATFPYYKTKKLGE